MCCMYATYEVISQMRKPWSGHDKNFKWPIWPWTFDLEMLRNTLWSNGLCVYLILSESVKYGRSYRADMAKTSNDPCDLTFDPENGAQYIRPSSLSFHADRSSLSWDTALTNLTLKIQGQGQGHGWGQSSKSQCGSNILSTYISFVPCQSSIPYLRYDFFQNLTLKIQGQGHGWGERWKSQHGPFHSWDKFFINMTLKIQSEGEMTRCCSTTGLDNSIELWMV